MRVLAVIAAAGATVAVAVAPAPAAQLGQRVLGGPCRFERFYTERCD